EHLTLCQSELCFQGSSRAFYLNLLDVFDNINKDNLSFEYSFISFNSK
ncbi:14143_t:CDS:1, partial [Cetraspora pellucida]